MLKRDEFVTKQEKKFEKGCCVKGRYETCHIIQVAEVVAGVKGISLEELVAVTLQNSKDTQNDAANDSSCGLKESKSEHEDGDVMSDDEEAR